MRDRRSRSWRDPLVARADFRRVRSSNAHTVILRSEATKDLLASLRMTTETLAAGVHIASIRPHEPEQRHPTLARQLDGQTRWRTDRGEHRQPGHERFLNQLEAHSAADDEYSLMSRQSARQELGADHLVERIVSADVLAQHHQPSIEVVERRGMQASGRCEKHLGVAQEPRE